MHFLKLERKNHIYSRRSWLEREFTLKETKTPVFDLPKDKAPGPDGFSWLFFSFSRNARKH